VTDADQEPIRREDAYQLTATPSHAGDQPARFPAIPAQGWPDGNLPAIPAPVAEPARTGRRHATRARRPPRVRGMNAAATLGTDDVGELTPAPRPLPLAQLLLAVAVAVAGVAAGVLTYQRLAAGSAAFPGEVTAAHVYTLDFASTGTLASMNVRPGQRVTRGQLLATEDSTAVRAQYASARAALKADAARLAAARRSGASAAAIAQAQARLAAAHAQLVTESRALAATSIRAPAAGTAVTAAGVPGSPVGPDGVRNGTGSPAAVVTVDSGPLTVTAAPPAADISSIRAGEPVTLTIAGLAGTVPGKIQQVTAQPGQSSGSLAYRVVIFITGRMPALSPGTTVSVSPN
jgi:multidrug efflux pump subunit AcrA (membrane-fusion protein)